MIRWHYSIANDEKVCFIQLYGIEYQIYYVEPFFRVERRIVKFDQFLYIINTYKEYPERFDRLIDAQKFCILNFKRNYVKNIRFNL